MNIYKRYETLSPIYQGGLTNHLPMVLTALNRMGVKEQIIIQKLDDYRDTLSLQDLTNINLGISDYEQEYINLTSKNLGDINLRGIDVVLGEFINKYKWNLYSALYHGLIRLAYAKKDGNPLMIAQALAYMELCDETVKYDVSHYLYDEDFESFYSDFIETFKSLNYTFESTRTMDKYKELIQNDLVKENIWYIRNISKEFVLNYILRGYYDTGCSYKLHLITGFEALLELEEYIYDFSEVLKSFFVSVQVFSLFSTDLVEKETTDYDLYDLEHRVEELEDFHDIKLLYSLIKLNKLFEHKLIKKIANRIFEK